MDRHNFMTLRLRVRDCIRRYWRVVSTVSCDGIHLGAIYVVASPSWYSKRTAQAFIGWLFWPLFARSTYSGWVSLCLSVSLVLQSRGYSSRSAFWCGSAKLAWWPTIFRLQATVGS
jgi:hypothetical protein